MRRRASILVVFIGVIWMVGAVSLASAQDATSEAPAPPACALTAHRGFANVRSEPSVSAPVITTINEGQTATGIAALYDRGGTLWYFTPAGWTAAVAVDASDGCAHLFQVTLYAEARRQHVQIVFDPTPGTGEADSYTQQSAIYGRIPRTPAITVHRVTITSSTGRTVCDQAECGTITLMLFIPGSGRVSGFFSGTPVPGATPEPISLDHLLYSSPAECLPVAMSCIVAIVRTPGDSSTTCPPPTFDQLLDIPTNTTPLQALARLTQDLREAIVQSRDTLQMTPRSQTALSSDTGCAFDVLVPVNEPGQTRFSMIDGGIEGIFNVIRVNPPGA